MSLTIAQIKAKVTPKLRGTTLARVSDFNEKCREAADNVVARCYPLETIRNARIENAIYSHVYNYVINQDVRGNKGIIDIRPISERSVLDDIEGRFSREFDIRKERDTYTIEVINGIKTLRLSKRINGHATLAGYNSLAGITTTGDVTGLELNSYDFINGFASVQFGLSGATGVGALAITIPAVNLANLEDVGGLFNWLNLADASRINSVTLKWGTNASNFWSRTVTSPSDRTAFESGAWTLQRFDWSAATKTGTPNAAAITYVEVGINYDTGAAIANNRLDSVTAALGKPYELVYYTNRFFKSPAGAYLEVPTSDGDVINIATEGHNLFLYELMLVLIQELGEGSVDKSAKWFQNQLNGYGNVQGLYEIYNRQYPCMTIPKSMTYYNFNHPEAGFNEDLD